MQKLNSMNINYRLLFGATAPIEDPRAVVSSLLFCDHLLVVLGTNKAPSPEHPYLEHLQPLAEQGLISFINLSDHISPEDSEPRFLAENLFQHLVEKCKKGSNLRLTVVSYFESKP